MSDFDSGDRTLPPTERRRREARQRGTVARSPRLTSAIILLSASSLFWMMSSFAFDPIKAFLRHGLTSVDSTSLTINSTSEMMRSAGLVLASVILPLLALSMVGAAVANLAQVGWLWVPSAIVPRFRGPRLNWGSRMIDALAFILRIAILGCFAWRFMTLHGWPLHSLSLIEPNLMLTQLTRMLAEFCLQISGCLILFGLIDYGYCYWRHEQSLKMTIEELRHEQREDAIDPHIRNRQKQTKHQRTVGPMILSEIGAVEPARES